MHMTRAGGDNLKPSAAFNDGKDAVHADDDNDYHDDDDDDDHDDDVDGDGDGDDGDYFTMHMAGDECPPLSSLNEKSERVAVDQEGRDFCDDDDCGDVAGGDGDDDDGHEGSD